MGQAARKGPPYLRRKRAALLEKDLCEELRGPRILRLAEPVNGLTTDFGVAMCANEFDEARDAVVLRQATERIDRLLLHLGIGILIDRTVDRGQRLIGSTLCQP